MGISVFGYFSFGNIFQQVSLRLVTHCAGGFVGGLSGFGYRVEACSLKRNTNVHNHSVRC